MEKHTSWWESCKFDYTCTPRWYFYCLLTLTLLVDISIVCLHLHSSLIFLLFAYIYTPHWHFYCLLLLLTFTLVVDISNVCLHLNSSLTFLSHWNISSLQDSKRPTLKLVKHFFFQIYSGHYKIHCINEIQKIYQSNQL